jgi:bifunctional non-homologous end joining protein LigD
MGETTTAPAGGRLAAILAKHGVGDGAPAPVAPRTPTSPHVRPVVAVAVAPAVLRAPRRLTANLAETAALKDLPRYVADDAFWLQAKLDGHRVMLHVVDNVPTALNRGGNPYGHGCPVAILNAFKSGFAGEWLFDGELINGVYVIFDILRAGGEDLIALPYSARLLTLTRLIHGGPNADGTVAPPLWTPPACVDLIQTARTPKEKKALAEQVIANCGEGLVVKRSSAPYRPGRRTSDLLKIKLWSSAEVIVSEVGRLGKESVAIEIYHNGRRVNAGAVTMLGKGMHLLRVGSVIECKYLYTVAGSCKLVQPEFLKIRTDKTPEECTSDQLKVTSKDVLDAGVRV